MNDTRTKSLVESIFNITVGISVAFVSSLIVLPYFGMPFSYASFGWISLIFTLISLVRSYVSRRLFVHGFYEDVFIKVFK